MRLDKISTVKEVAKPQLVKEGDTYKVLDINGVERKVFEDIDLAKLWMKKHNPELKEGVEPVLYTSEIMEGVLDSTDEDGWMAKSQLYKMSKYAIELHGMIGDTDNLEPWVQAKLTKAADYLGAVKHYMEYLAVNEYPVEPPVVVDDMPDEM
jgi:hypothetical protein